LPVLTPKPDRRIQAYVSIGLFVLTALLRVPFQSQYLYHWDSVQYALATEHYDVSIDQPQRPGYILYVALGDLLNIITGDPQTSFVWLSIVASALAVVAVYHLGRVMFDQRIGVIAALMLLVSPLFWFFGEIAMPHVLEAFFVIVLAILLYRIAEGNQNLIFPAALWLGIATGVRQTTILFIFPLCVLAVIVGRVRISKIVLSILVLGFVCLLWFVPMVWLSGGLDRYISIFMAHNQAGLGPTSIFTAGLSGPIRNLAKLSRYTLYAWGLATLPGILFLLILLLHWKAGFRSRRAAFLAVWLLPALAFYTLIHMGNQGLVLVFLPSLVLISATGLVRLTSFRQSQLLPIGLIAILLLNASMFLFAPEYLLPGNRLKVLSWQTIRNLDARYRAKIALIQEHFPAGQTVVLARAFRHASYYLPAYRVFRIRALDERVEGSMSQIDTSKDHDYRIISYWESDMVPDDVRYLLLFDEDLLGSIQNRALTQLLVTEEGEHLYYFVLEEDQAALIRCCLPEFLGLP